jgi:hypothetical protein
MPKTKHAEHGESKNGVSFALTPTGLKGLAKMAQERKISRSELVERIGRGIIPVAGLEEQQLGESYAN